MNVVLHPSSDTDLRVSGQAGAGGRGRLVPYVASWSEEPLSPSVLVDRGVAGIGYADETFADRDRHGVLWQRQPSVPGVGRPEFGRIHPIRQRRAMRRLLCSVCAGPADANEHGVLWLLRDFREDWPGWPNGLAVREPPVCRPCAHYAVRACPSLRQGWVAVRVGQSTVAGVYGVLYRAGSRGPVPVEDVTVAFDDPAIRWVRAAQLVREITQCRIVDLDAESEEAQ